MRPILVISVPHSGTFFTLDLMPGKRGVLSEGVRTGHKYFCHVDDPFAGDALKHCFAVVPLRAFEEVEASWLRRRIDVSDLPRQWKKALQLEAFFLPLDAENRDVRLNELSAWLGVQLHTDWQRTHSMRARWA